MQPPSATNTPATAPKPVAQPQRARVTFRLTEPEAAKCGLLDRWRTAMVRRQHRAARKQHAQAQLAEAVSGLVARATAEHWSQRQLAAKMLIPETTFRRIRNQQVDPLLWLPKVAAAVAKLSGPH